MTLKVKKQFLGVHQEDARSEEALQIALLGEFSLQQGETVVSLETPSHQALLAYLIVHANQIHSRKKLAFLIWPDSSESQARTNLRKAIHTIRSTLPHVDNYLDINRQTLQWCLGFPSVVDIWEFEKAIEQSREAGFPTDQQSCLMQAIEAYHGDFMPGHYDDWIIAAREEFRQDYLTALEKQLTLCESQQLYLEATDMAQKLMREDPLHEAAYRRLMRLQALDGNLAGALRTYHTCSTRLQGELGVDPSPATQEVYERLLCVQAPLKPMAPARLPLVARRQAWETLQSAWQQCNQGQPSVVMLTGEAGIGKTRLAEEMMDWARRQGIIVISAVCYPSEKQLAYAPVAKWLRSEQLQPIFRRLPERQLVECSRLLPELQKEYPNLPGAGSLTESWQRQHFFSALAQTILQLRQPFLLFLDDLPCCDRDTLDWLHYLLQYEPPNRFLLMAAARSEDMTPDHQLIPWQQQLQREGRLTNIELDRLDVEASAQLAGHLLQTELDSQQAGRLYEETEGNPLFVVEMTRAGLVDLGPATQSATLPPKVQVVIETRLASLNSSAYQLAQLAAVVGNSFTFAILNGACSQSDESIIRNLDELWQRRLIREHGVDAYSFNHDKIRQVAYESLSLARRRQFHSQVWQAMETIHADNIDAVSGKIGAHCEAAGNYQEASVYYRRAAKVAQAVYANQDTLDYLQRVIDLIPRTEIESLQQAEIYEQQGDVLIIVGRYEEAEAALTKAVHLIEEPLAQARIYRKIGNTWQLRRQNDKAFDTWERAENKLSHFSSTWPRAYWQEWLAIQLDKSWVLYWTARLEALESLLEEIHPTVTEQGKRLQQGLYYQRLVVLAMRRDRYLLDDKAIAYARESLAAIEESGTLKQVAFSQFVLGFALSLHGWEGDFSDAEYHMKSALMRAREIGDIVVQIRCLFHLSQIYLRQGDMESAGCYLPQAIELARKADALDYIVLGEGLLAWSAWRKHEFVESQRLGEHALALAREMSLVWPSKYFVSFPLISIALMHNEDEKAVEYARLPLVPDQMCLPDELTTVLQKATDAWESNRADAARTYLKQALRLAEKYHYL